MDRTVKGSIPLVSWGGRSAQRERKACSSPYLYSLSIMVP